MKTINKVKRNPEENKNQNGKRFFKAISKHHFPDRKEFLMEYPPLSNRECEFSDHIMKAKRIMVDQILKRTNKIR